MKRIGVLLLLFWINNFAQPNKNLDGLIQQCETLKNNENYQKLTQTATQGIKKSTNTYYLSKFNFYKAYGLEYDNNQYEKAIPYFEKSLEFAKQGNHLKDETLALMRLNYLYYSTKQFSKRDSLIKYVKTVVDTTKNIYTQGILNGTLGEYYLDNSDVENFIGYKLKAIEYRKKFPKTDVMNEVNIGISYSQIGQAYNKMKQFQKGIEYFDYAKPYLLKSNNSLAFLYIDYIKSYTGLNKIDSIQTYSHKIEKLVTVTDSLHICVSLANKNLAEYYLTNKNRKLAEKYIRKALFFANKSNDTEALMESQITDGKILYENKNYEDAIKILSNAEEISKDFDANSHITTLSLLAQSYAKTQNYKKAFEYQQLFSKANAKVLNEKSLQTLANAEFKYQNKNKQERINLLSAENRLKNFEISTNKKNLIYVTIGLLLVVIFSILLLRQSIQRKKLNNKLQKLNQELELANKTKTRFFSILNHDLRAPVANLVNFLQLQSENPDLLDEETAKHMHNKTIIGAENLLNSMEDILQWSKSQMENFKPQPKKVLVSKIFDDIKSHFSSFEKIELLFENQDNIVSVTDENYLKTIIRNLTANAIKATENIENPKTIPKAWQENNQSLISTTDNGKGADLEQFKALYDETEVTGIKLGLGLHLIRDMAKAISCSVSLDKKIQNGTSLVLIFTK